MTYNKYICEKKEKQQHIAGWNPGSESSGALTPRNDIALLKLDKSPALDSGSVGPACLPGAGEVLTHGAACYLSGWGNLYSKTLLPVGLGEPLQ